MLRSIRDLRTKVDAFSGLLGERLGGHFLQGGNKTFQHFRLTQYIYIVFFTGHWGYGQSQWLICGEGKKKKTEKKKKQPKTQYDFTPNFSLEKAYDWEFRRLDLVSSPVTCLLLDKLLPFYGCFLLHFPSFCLFSLSGGRNAFLLYVQHQAPQSLNAIYVWQGPV